MNKFLGFLLLALSIASCSPFQKALKSDDVAEKNKVADVMYEKGKYSKAIRLYEQVAPVYKGKPQGERMFYYYSKALYSSKQYYVAGYQFESFVASYPKSEKREECAFLGAECFYKMSPAFSLDQTDSEKAISKMQKFIDTYSESEYLPQANAYVKELREKMEEKAFEIAKQYNTIADYRLEYDVAIKALDNFIADYPGTPYKEEALFYKLDSAHRLALNSVYNKKEERLNFAKTTYNNLIKFKSNTEFKEKADEILASIDKELQQFSK